MQLSEEKLEAMLKTCVPGGSLCDPQAIADDIREWFSAALRAQADARPVWQIQGAPDSWLDVDEETWKWSDESRRRIVYTHPEASAPGLSADALREGRRLLAALLTGDGRPALPDDVAIQVHDWLCVPIVKLHDILTRASAATSSADARIEELRKGLFEARDALVYASDLLPQRFQAKDHRFFLAAIERANAVLSGAAIQPDEADK
ncbi:hypothetical protein [Ralstonia mannitolilytica]|uniref:hypothetical protein n=1 Tax=Ralstonia mannitolilytica TaxID=105219 RepID=UPI003749D6C9